MSDNVPDHTRLDRSTAPRRLVAILMADIVDYTALTQRDERGIISRVERLRQELILPTIRDYHGTLIKQRGDGFLCTFDSPVECVRAAIIIQQSMVADNLERPENERIRFRIGVNLGDVIIASDDIYGDGVNVAARLEQLADPGTIYISGGVYEQVRYKLVCGYQPLGDRRLKNIQDPVPIYRVLPDPMAVNTVAKKRWERIAAIAAVCLLLIAGGGGGWYFFMHQPKEPALLVTSMPPSPQPVPPSPQPIPLQPTIQKLPEPPVQRQETALQKPPEPPLPTQVQPALPPLPPSLPVANPSPPAAVTPPPPKPTQQAMVVPPPAPPPLKLPDVIQINGGSFEMGSNEDPSEQPIHRVSVNSFVIGKSAVTVGEWRECVKAGVCSYNPHGDDDQPLGNVSWNDTEQYLTWLSGVTHRQWRLPTEAEWEYAARGGTRTRFWWGDAMKPGMAICKGCGVDHREPLRIAANPFGIYINDGVSEWVQDCWGKDYRGVPTNGSAYTLPDCRNRVLRGASASNNQSYARPASRDYYDGSVRYPTHGFRIASSQ